MSNPTSNFGWQMPTPTDLVTDLPADFEVFGQAVDTSLADLKGGTTGQVLSKTTNADMDFTWVAPTAGDIEGVTAGVGISGGGTSGTVTITNDMATTITASGDIVVGTGSGTYDNLPIGTTGQILTADTTVSPYKVKWATPAGGGKVLQVVQATYSTATTNSTTTYADTGLTASITPSSASSKILVIATQAFEYQQGQDAAGGFLKILRGSTGIYEITGLRTNIGGASLALLGGLYTMNYLDSPATTSSTTYKTQMRLESTGGSFKSVTAQYSDYGNATSTMILMEIGA